MIQQNKAESKTWIRLSNDEWLPVPDGANPETFRKVKEAELKKTRKPKRRRSRRTSTSRGRRFSAGQVLSRIGFFNQESRRNRATATRLDELNDNQPEARFITASGSTTVEVF